MWCVFLIEIILIKVVIYWTWKKLDKAQKKLDCGQALAFIKFGGVIRYTTNYY